MINIGTVTEVTSPNQLPTLAVESIVSGLLVKTVRYYNHMGLLKIAWKSVGYQTYDDASIRKFVFILMSCEFDFTMKNLVNYLIFPKSWTQ